MTRYEEIKSLSINQMAEFIDWVMCNLSCCRYCRYRDSDKCLDVICPPSEKLIKKYLNEEVSDGDF